MEKLRKDLDKFLEKKEYTKTEVIKYILKFIKAEKNKFRKEVIDEIESKFSELRGKIDNDYYFRISAGLIIPDHKDRFRTELYDKLKNKDFFKDEVKIQDFKRVFQETK